MFACFCGGIVEAMVMLALGSCSFTCVLTWCINFFRRKHQCCGHKAEEVCCEPE